MAEAACRSRVLGLSLELERTYSDLADMRDAVIMELLTTCDDSMFPVTTKTDRTAWLKRGLERRTRLRELRHARDAAKYVLEDLDKMDFRLEKILKTFDLQTRPEVHR